MNKKTAFFCLIFLIAYGLSFLSPAVNSAYAESNEAADGNGHSGGFIVKTEKVEGQMDLVGALIGKISIKEGTIHGLTITKTLETGMSEDPLMIKITSPGPIKVQNLKAGTINGLPPSIGDLCKPSKPGWICLKDVTMKVTEQSASEISLPEASVQACYQSQCGGLPDYKPMTKKEVKDILNEEKAKEDEEQSDNKQPDKEQLGSEQPANLDDIKNELQKDKENLDKAKDILDEASDVYEKIKNGNPTEELKKLTDKINDLLEDNVIDGTTDKLKELVAKLKELEKEATSFGTISETFTKLTDEADRLVQDLQNSINTTKEQLNNLNDSNKENEDKSVVDSLKQRADQILNKTEAVKDKVSNLTKKKGSLQNKTESINKKLNKLKSTISEAETSGEGNQSEDSSDGSSNDNNNEKDSGSGSTDDGNTNDGNTGDNNNDDSEDDESSILGDLIDGILGGLLG
ncbi:coiled-coil domain-containing protein [Virgibacillus doumboii]|uniref:coiled-coil domain-containing protein n=1 Tax=Virgibacillus doumboii TaxID=2697503 RepID=UPI0013DF053C|nr:hypothetical protein [Virgibacillus doumboii]